MRRHDIRSEDGWILVTSMMLLAIMISIALASFAFVDTGQQRSREQRERETSLNVAEGVLYSQGFKLAQGWPGNGVAAGTVPTSCTQAPNPDPVLQATCPDPNALAAANATVPAAANFTNVDASANVTWATKIRDNGGSLAGSFVTSQADVDQSGTNVQTGASYTCAGPCKWDANGDKQLWVQARAVVRDRPRNVVALLKLERVLEATPEAAVTSGGVNIDNNGNKIMVYANGSQVVVRCNTSQPNCASYQAGQIQPPPVTGNPPSLMTASQLARFKQRAITDGRYYAGCPDNDISGAVVWVEACSSAQMGNNLVTQPCDPPAPPQPGGGGNGLSQSCINQYGRPGILIWHCGVADFSGAQTFVGIVYGVNNSDGTCPAGYGARGNGNCNGNVNSPNNVVTMTGGFGVWGALAIDGQGCLYAGSNGIQIQYDPNVFGAAASYGTVGLVQNTWRELAPN